MSKSEIYPETSAAVGPALFYQRCALLSLVALIILSVAWEWLLAPLRPGGSWLVVKGFLLLLPLRGIYKRDIYTMQWSSMLIWLYFTEGVVRGFSDTVELSRYLAWTQTALTLTYFMATIMYVRPYKKAAKAAAKAALAKARESRNTEINNKGADSKEADNAG